VNGDLQKWARGLIGKLVCEDAHTLGFDWTSKYTGKPDDVCRTDCFSMSDCLLSTSNNYV